MTLKIRKIFIDHHDSELESYVNADGLLYIGINVSQDCHEGECVALGKKDVDDLIEHLQDLRKEMEA